MPRPTDNPPWLFALLVANGGIGFWGVNALLVPYLLRKYGVPVDRIAEVVAVGSVPGMWYFLWSPIVDLGLRRRTWILACSALSSLCILGTVWAAAGSLPVLTALLVAGVALATVASSAIGAVMTTLPPHVRGRASGWYQAGNVGAGSLVGGATIWVANHVSLHALAILCAVISFLPALAALFIVERPHPRLAPGPLFSELFRDVRELLWSGKTAVGVIFFVSPVGAGALGNLISGLGPDFHAPASEVAWVTGLSGSLLIGLGGLCGGFVCDRLNRMTAYALVGMVAGLCSVWLGFGSASPFTYGAGYSAYAFTTGFAFTAFTALMLETLGIRKRGAATGYSILNSMGNVPVAYMTWMDGVGYKHWGARGLMSVDAAANLGGGLLLLLLARYCVNRWKGVQPQGAPVAFAQS